MTKQNHETKTNAQDFLAPVPAGPQPQSLTVPLRGVAQFVPSPSALAVALATSIAITISLFSAPFLSPRVPASAWAFRVGGGRTRVGPPKASMNARAYLARHPRCHSRICHHDSRLFRGILGVASAGHRFLCLAPLSHGPLHRVLHRLRVARTARVIGGLLPVAVGLEHLQIIVGPRGMLLFLAPWAWAPAFSSSPSPGGDLTSLVGVCAWRPSGR